MITIWQGVILGLIQGVAEWLPISSEAMVVLVGINVLQIDPSVILSFALILHLGTLLSAIWYFRRDLLDLGKNFSSRSTEWRFLLVATGLSVILGGLIYLSLRMVTVVPAGGALITIAMGIALIITSWLLAQKHAGQRSFREVTTRDAVLLGLMQAMAIIPGISRSGSTTAIALWRNFGGEDSLRVSFIMGIPMIFIGSILLALEGQANDYIFTTAGLAALAAAAVCGWLTIAGLLRVAKRVNFSKFTFGLGVLSVVAGLYSLLV